MAPLRTYRGKVRKSCFKEQLDNRENEDALFERLLGNQKVKVFDSSSDQRDSTGPGPVSKPVKKTQTTKLPEPFVFFKNETLDLTVEFPLPVSPTVQGGKENGEKIKMKYKRNNGYLKLVEYEDRTSADSSQQDCSKSHVSAKKKRNTKKTRKITKKKRKPKSLSKELSRQQNTLVSKNLKAIESTKPQSPAIMHMLPSPIPSIHVGVKQVYACSTPIRGVPEFSVGLGSNSISFTVENACQVSRVEPPSPSNVQSSVNPASNRDSKSTEQSDVDMFSRLEEFEVNPLSIKKSKWSVESRYPCDTSPSSKCSIESEKIDGEVKNTQQTISGGCLPSSENLEDESLSSFHGFDVPVDLSLKNKTVNKSKVEKSLDTEVCLRKTLLIRQSTHSLNENKAGLTHNKVLSKNSLVLDSSRVKDETVSLNGSERIDSASKEHSFSEQMSRCNSTTDRLRHSDADCRQQLVACSPSFLNSLQSVSVLNHVSFKSPSQIENISLSPPFGKSKSTDYTVSDIFADSAHQPEADYCIENISEKFHTYTFLDNEDVAFECTIPYSSSIPCNMSSEEENSCSEPETKVSLKDEKCPLVEIEEQSEKPTESNITSEQAFLQDTDEKRDKVSILRRESSCNIVLRSMTRKTSLHEACPTIAKKLSDNDKSVEVNTRHSMCDKVLRSMTRRSSISVHQESKRNQTSCTESTGSCQIILEEASDDDCGRDKREETGSGPWTRLKSKKSIQLTSHSNVTDEVHEKNQAELVKICENSVSKVMLSSDAPAKEPVKEEGHLNPYQTPALPQCYVLVRKSDVISGRRCGGSQLPVEPLPKEISPGEGTLNTGISESDKNNGESHSVTPLRKTEGASGETQNAATRSPILKPRVSSLGRRSFSWRNRSGANKSEIEHEDMIGELEERIVLPGGRKYRRSMSLVRQLMADELEETSLIDQLQHKGRKYSSFVESVIDLQPLGDRSIVNKGCESLAVERIGRTLSCLHLNTNYGPDTTPTCTKRRTSIKPPSLFQDGQDVDYKELLLKLSKQKEPCGFDELLEDNCLEKCRKIGEGVFGEVFMVTRQSPMTGEDRKVVLKIIPIEGDFLVNGEPQKRCSEVYSELIISNVLDGLKNGVKDSLTGGFMEVVRSWLIQGSYPEMLLELWHDYNNMKGSENDSPEIFQDDQLFLVLEVGNAGADLEGYTFSTASQALSVFKQVVLSLAVAESAFEFEHRDLHWGNILVSKTVQHTLPFTLEGRTFHIKTFGVKGTIIDYTLSSMTHNEKRIYNDVGKDPDMFIATGDYQFDIYRHMKEDLGNNWESFVPKTNVRWLHYLVDKLITSVRYSRKTAKVHRDSMKQLRDIETWLLDCDTSVQVALNIVGEN